MTKVCKDLIFRKKLSEKNEKCKNFAHLRMIENGHQIGRYKILSAIGAGGMGEVFLAEDTRLHRKVALKVLPESIAFDKERLGRFEQEARAASGLNHPNILTVYEQGMYEESFAAFSKGSVLLKLETPESAEQKMPL